MKLVVNKDLKDNGYKVDLQVLDITDTDKEKISDFGEIVVDVGGQVMGKETVQEYVAVQEPVTEIVIETQTVTEKQMVDETQLVFEADGVTPVYEADGVTQKTQVVQVEKDVDVQKDVQVVKPVLDVNGEPVYQDKLDVNGEKIYQLEEKEVDVVLADLGKQLRNFPSDFPLARTFTVTEFGENARLVAETYITRVTEALQIAVDAVEQREDTFSGKQEIQL